MTAPASDRGSWASRVGFVLAASGSAVGLGNVWRFPYITGENGGGLFVLIYLVCIALVGLPIMIVEILIGRAAGRSNVTAFRRLAGQRTPWAGLGWMGVVAAYLILSFYAVVAGWTLHYAFLSVTGSLAGRTAAEVQAAFAAVNADIPLNLLWVVAFMTLTMGVVAGGVRRGLERWSRILMPALGVLLLVLVGRAAALPGFVEGAGFVFGLHAGELTPAGVLEALGHAFFTLSVGMGGLLTYGSYLGPDARIVRDSVVVTVFDTLIALAACLVIFPVIFAFGLEPAQGPGLIFSTLPAAFAQMPGGSLLAAVFFFLLVFAALTSAISLLEVATAYFVDERGWSRRRATLTAGCGITLLAVPSALTGGTRLFGAGMAERLGADWFTLVSGLASNWLMPIGGLGMALFVAWRLDDTVRRAEFGTSVPERIYRAWLLVLRYLVPLAIVAVLLHAVGVV